MSLRTYLLFVLYASAIAAVAAAWFIASVDPTAGHDNLMKQIRQRNAEIERRLNDF